MKHTENKSPSKKKTGVSRSFHIVIDKKLDSLCNTILFPEKLAKANRILAKAALLA
ncbi:MAG TPA: hypothetical protein VNZ86_09795 [Bacteroidia bacterium]|jgi:hypothetical protein|nr:hypothetical protein [Bacteroidia bacterium]